MGGVWVSDTFKPKRDVGTHMGDTRYYATRCPLCEHVAARMWKNGYPSPFRHGGKVWRKKGDKDNRPCRVKCYRCEKRFKAIDGYMKGSLSETPGAIMKYVAEASANDLGWSGGFVKAVDL